jgi:hypothetical protein
MIRFVDEVPQHIYLSRHAGGEAYTIDALTRVYSRPITYSASGSHANYVGSGKQNYKGDMLSRIGLSDTTDAGVLWDITRNYRG